jgi:hypothetical protein
MAEHAASRSLPVFRSGGLPSGRTGRHAPARCPKGNCNLKVGAHPSMSASESRFPGPTISYHTSHCDGSPARRLRAITLAGDPGSSSAPAELWSVCLGGRFASCHTHTENSGSPTREQTPFVAGCLLNSHIYT